MNKKQRRTLVRIIVSFVIYALLFALEHTGALDAFWLPVKLVMFLIPYAVIGYDIIFKAARNISHGRVFDENFLMMIATFGAFCIGEYSEGVAVMLFYQVGELFQSCAVGKSRQSITAMMDICPEYANLETDGGLVRTDPDDVEVGSIIVIKPGERIPLDGIVEDGESYIDTAALTGESVPRHAVRGDSVVSGCVNKNGTLKVRTTKEFDDSTVAKILELVENASEKKAKIENFITRFARYYTPVVTIGAAALAVIPPIVLGIMSGILPSWSVWGEWIERACIFLVISCPCALVISVPMGFFGGIGAASKIGVLVKGSNFLEAVSELDTIVFDKTGTLTRGEFTVSEILCKSASEDEILTLAALGEGYSNHPIAVSIRAAFEGALDLTRVSAQEEIPGRGVKAVIDSKDVLIGNAALMRDAGIECETCGSIGTIVHVAANGEYLGAIAISDAVKDGAGDAVAALKRAGVKKAVMLTGDRRAAAEGVAEQVGADAVYAELLPGDKVEIVEELMRGVGKGKKLAFVGDGINDAPVLSRADVGIAMGSMGSDAAIEAADIVIMDDDIQKIPKTVGISKKTLGIVRQNIVFALAVKAAILLLGALGMANMWEAVFADVGVAVIAIVNSMRALNVRE